MCCHSCVPFTLSSYLEPCLLYRTSPNPTFVTQSTSKAVFAKSHQTYYFVNGDEAWNLKKQGKSEFFYFFSRTYWLLFVIIGHVSAGEEVVA